ncbi:MAG: hypothetical protein M0T72_04405 [Candidatus Dormibacteraeota bacterium]|nr:hypothetical protein [Candidatus Dormibacteraeota bacterium]
MIPPPLVDLVAMTGDLSQVSPDEDDWASTSRAAHTAQRTNGHLVFDARNPVRQAGRERNCERSSRRLQLSTVDSVAAWVELPNVSLPLISWRWTFVFDAEGVMLWSDSTLRFRTHGNGRASLRSGGFAAVAVRDAPDRHGRELGFIAPPPGVRARDRQRKANCADSPSDAVRVRPNLTIMGDSRANSGDGSTAAG